MKKLSIRNLVIIIFLVLISISLGACSKNLDGKKLETIKYGMSEKEVEKDLGTPSKSTSDVKKIKKELAQYMTFKSIVPKKIGESIDSQLVDNIDETLEEMQTKDANLTIYTYELDSDQSVLLLFVDKKLASYMFIKGEEEKISISSMEFWCL